MIGIFDSGQVVTMMPLSHLHIFDTCGILKKILKHPYGKRHYIHHLDLRLLQSGKGIHAS